MCGRFAQVIKHEQLKKLMDELAIANRDEQIEINYNVAPTQTTSAFIATKEARLLSHFRWGLIPSWSKEVPQYQMINVRADTILEKKTFKAGLQYRRCLIPATGFYEWRKPDKQPFFIHSTNGKALLLAGIYESWNGSNGSFVQSCAIITTEPNDKTKEIHDRMPVILDGLNVRSWLTHGLTDAVSLQFMLQPCNNDLLSTHPVSRFVNSVKNNGEACIQRVD